MAQFSNKVNLNESPLPQPKHPCHKPQGNQPAFDLRTHLYRISGVDFRAIDGLGILTVQTIISEVGLDPTRFPTVKHFTSWLGLCPCNRITGGKIKSSKTRLQDWQIIIASRNLPKVEEVVQQLTAETNYSFIEGMTLDLASLASVRQFVQDFQTREHPPLHAIVCNAGVQIVLGTRYTENGFEMTFGVNHLGHFLLVNLLLPQLSDRSRIVFVSSDTHNPEANTGMAHPNYQDANALAFPTGDDSQMDIGTVGRVRYTTSKLCNLLCTYELSRRLQKQQSKMTVNAFNPGLMLDTKLSRDYSESERSALRATLSASTLGQSRDSQVMGSALARLILDPALDQVTGRYFDGLKEIRSSDESYDEHKAVELWETSVGLTH